MGSRHGQLFHFLSQEAQFQILPWETVVAQVKMETQWMWKRLGDINVQNIMSTNTNQFQLVNKKYKHVCVLYMYVNVFMYAFVCV